MAGYKRKYGGRNSYRKRMKGAWKSKYNARTGTLAFKRALNRRGVASKDTGFVDLPTASYALDTTGTITLLATVPQGASVGQRIGKKAIMKSLMCRGSIASNTATTTTDIAYLIVYDKRPQGSLPAISDILASAHPSSMNNDDNSSRFQILKRVNDVLIGSTGAGLTEQSRANADWYLGLKGKKMTFNSAGTGAIGDIDEGALYLVTVGSNASGTSAAVLSAQFRFRFQDV